MPLKKNKYNARFPPARIKKMMQKDEEIGKVAAAVPVIISRSLELFVETLVKKTYDLTVKRGSRTLTPSHVKLCIGSESRFDFLKDLVSTVPDLHGDSDDQPPTPSTSASAPMFAAPSSSSTTSTSTSTTAKPKKNEEKRRVKTRIKEVQEPGIKRKRGRKPKEPGTTKPVKVARAMKPKTVLKVTPTKTSSSSSTPTVDATLKKSKQGRKKKRQLIHDDFDDDDYDGDKIVQLNKSSPPSSSTAIPTATVEVRVTAPPPKLNLIHSETEAASQAIASVTTTQDASSLDASQTVPSSALVTEAPKSEPIPAPVPKPFRPNHIPAQLVSASAMATAKPTKFHRSLAFKDFKQRSENLKSGSINFSLSYSVPVKDAKDSMVSADKGLTCLQSDQPSQLPVKSAAPWSSQGGVDEDYDA